MERELLTKIGDRIREIRKATEVSQEDLAIVAHLMPAEVALIEEGKVDARVETLHRIAEALNIPLKKLVE